MTRSFGQNFWKQGKMHSLSAHFVGNAENWDMSLYDMDLITAGEEFYATMRRSTNGGGENSPMLEGEDDFYELFFAGLE